MSAAERIEWWSDHPVLLWSQHPCDEVWDAVSLDLTPENDNGRTLVALAKTSPSSPPGLRPTKTSTSPACAERLRAHARGEAQLAQARVERPATNEELTKQRRASCGWGLTPYRFTGKEEDVEVGLQYFGKRYLNPLLGRWISADPLAIHAPGEADLNVYAYVSGAVLKNVDPLGLEEEAAAFSATYSQEAPTVGPGTVDLPEDTIHAGGAEGLEEASPSVLEGGPQGEAPNNGIGDPNAAPITDPNDPLNGNLDYKPTPRSKDDLHDLRNEPINVVDTSETWRRGMETVAILTPGTGVAGVIGGGIKQAVAKRAIAKAAAKHEAKKRAAEEALKKAAASKAEKLAANRAAGAAAEKVAARQLISEGNTILASQVSVRTSLGLRRIDHLIQTPSGQIIAIEVKAGNAVRSSAQRAKDAALATEGGVLVGKNAPEALRGEHMVIETVERVIR